MTFANLASKRYSCKKYGEKQLLPEQLEAILEVGRMAPTAKNLQPQHIYAIQSPEGLAKVDALTPCRYGAPTVLMVAFNTNNVFTYPGGKRDSGIGDASIVATHLVLAAADAGVDSCWVNLFDPKEAHDAFGLPDDEGVLMFLDLGFAAEDAGPLANHASRKELSDTVTYL